MPIIVKKLRTRSPNSNKCGWPFTSSEIGQTLHQTDLTGPMARGIWPSPRWTKSRLVGKDQIRRNAPYERYRTFASKEGIADHICPRRDWSTRLFIDYRTLSAVTSWARSQFHEKMYECLDLLGGVRILPMLDVNFECCWIEIDDRDSWKTTFTSLDGLHRFIRMPFNPKDAWSTIWRATGAVLSKVKWQVALVYLNDVVMLLRSVEKHLDDIQTDQTTVYSCCTIDTEKMLLLGRLCKLLGLLHTSWQAMHFEKSDQCSSWTTTPNEGVSTQVLSCSCNVFRRVVPNLTHKTAFSTYRLEKDQHLNFARLN